MRVPALQSPRAPRSSGPRAARERWSIVEAKASKYNAAYSSLDPRFQELPGGLPTKAAPHRFLREFAFDGERSVAAHTLVEATTTYTHVAYLGPS